MMILTSNRMKVIALTLLASQCFALTSLIAPSRTSFTKPAVFLKQSSTRLFMSDVPSPDDNENWLQLPLFSLPPPPEDHLILAGDLMSIFVYGFTDHFVCHDLAIATAQKSAEVAAQSASTSIALAAASDGGGSTNAIMSLLSVASPPPSLAVVNHPVWLDPSHSYAPNVLHVLHESHLVSNYSPLLQPVGVACCVLASAWLVGGWLQGAFLHRNTLECSTEQALRVTAKAWIITCAIMLYLVATTSWLNDAILQTSPMEWNGFTKGDVDYILDSLIIIGFWRWIASYMMGYGGGNGKS
ncbi:hypothetical protein MPSEU_000979500 [Mayamaea pseudoterrestris]|nr:hypothetical protein MPSEU_000979500 [Mayamaea pseudoterrestris]